MNQPRVSNRERAIAGAMIRCGCVQIVAETVAKFMNVNIGNRKAAECEPEIVMALARCTIVASEVAMPPVEFDRSFGHVAREIIADADHHRFEAV